MSAHFLCIAAIFKNEAHILKEWLDNHIAEGFDHFYLIDNGSTDSYLEVLQPYVEKGLVSLFTDTRKHVQGEVYDKYVLPFRKQIEWLLVCDLDEFAYGQNVPLRSFISHVNKFGALNGVQLPWVEFGSSGRETQPESVVGGFRMRRKYDPTVKNVDVKTIVRMRDVISLGIHIHDIRNWIIINGCQLSVKNCEFSPVNEDYVRRAVVRINHYRVQSRDWFFNVKARRGDACRNDRDSWRNEEHFRMFDYNDVEDNVLARKRGKMPV